ncbi:MAG: hypothetical protein Q9207_002681 [Kuettlingeria erythrocarpa]
MYTLFHLNHTLFDDRTIRLIGQQLRRAYTDLGSLPKGRDLSAYLSWVRNRPAAAMDYWTAHLLGIRPCLISLLSSSESSLLERGSPPYIDVPIDQPGRWHSFCRQNGVSVANLAQVAWGTVLRLCHASQPVVFACSQSQTGAVEGGETTLGPLIVNIICKHDVGPTTSTLELLRRARDDTVRALELPSYSMDQLHEALGLGQSSIFDTCMTVVRLPPTDPPAAEGVRIEYLVQEKIPTEAAVVIGIGYDNDTVRARLWYDTAKVSRSLAAQIGSLFAAVATRIGSGLEQPIRALESSISKPHAAFSPQDVARSVYREVASQCELAAASLEDLAVCTPSQRQQMQGCVQPDSGSSADQYVFRVPEHASMSRLHDAWDVVAAACPALRTRIVKLRQGGIYQVIVRTMPGWHEDSSLADYLQWDEDLRIRYGGPLCRFGEVDEPDGKRYMVLTLHPAIYDPWTLSLILSAVRKAYDATGETQPPAPFHPFSAYMRRLSGRTDAQSAPDFWRAQPQWSDEGSLQFPRVPHGASKAGGLSSSRWLDMQMPMTDARDNGVPTAHTVRHTAWALCLSRLNGDGKTCFGVQLDGRGAPVDGIARVTGPVAGIVPCAIDLATLSTGHSLLGLIREYDSAVTPFLHTPNSSETFGGHGVAPTPRPWANVLILPSDPTSDPSAGPPEILEPAQTRFSASSFNGAKLVTRCSIMPKRTLRIVIHFDRRTISPEDIEVALQQYKHAITQLLSKASAPLADLERVSDYERSLLLEWNRHSPSLVDACMQDQIRDTAKRQPTAPAVCAWDGDLDHRQLDDLSDRLAALLHAQGIQAGVTVPFFCEKSAAAVILMLGILKAGGALLPLDVDHPAPRLVSILADVGSSTIVASSALSEKVRTKVSAQRTVTIDMERLRTLPPGGPAQVVAVQPSGTCYLAFTSGSTGTPKGIVISHANLASSVHHNRALFGMTAATRTLQFSNFIFDAVLYEVFMTLVTGGCICVPQEAERLNDITGAIQRTRTNCALLAPSTDWWPS